MGSKLNWLRARFCTPSGHIPKVNILFGFFLIVNYCLGTGFLGIPYAFFYAGYLAAIPTILVIAFFSWLNANYLLEVMARGQALEYFDALLKSSDDSDIETEKITTAATKSEIPSFKDQPKFEITHERKFEVAELCEIFFNKYVKYLYLFLLSIHSFLVRWSFAAVAASAWSVNIPFENFGEAEMCMEDAFLHNIIPSDGCLYAYYFCLFMFAIIVVTLSMFDLKQQAVIQFVLGVMRFITVLAMVIYCIVKLTGGNDACIEQLKDPNITTPFNVPLTPTVVRFDGRGWLLAVPIFVYAFTFHTGISSLTHPVSSKRFLHWMIFCSFFAALISYLCLGVIIPLWFRASIQETVTLNWATFTGPSNHAGLQALSYYLILFPSLDVISAYPLINHVMVNNLYVFITGRDTSTAEPKYRFDKFLRVFLRFVNALLPVLAAFGVANLVYVLKYAGLISFMCFTFPVFLQLKSIRDCKKRFSMIRTEQGSIQMPEIADREFSRSSSTKDFDEDVGSSSLEEKELLPDSKLSRKKSNSIDKKFYMTPYSSGFLSHPITAWVAVGVGLVLLVLATLSLFIAPHTMSCYQLAVEMQLI